MKKILAATIKCAIDADVIKKAELASLLQNPLKNEFSLIKKTEED